MYVKQDATANSIRLSASQSDIGKNESVVEAQIDGDELNMAFSSKFLGDMLSNIEADKLILETSSPTTAGVFRIDGDDSYLHLLMPMRL